MVAVRAGLAPDRSSGAIDWEGARGSRRPGALLDTVLVAFLAGVPALLADFIGWQQAYLRRIGRGDRAESLLSAVAGGLHDDSPTAVRQFVGAAGG